MKQQEGEIDLHALACLCVGSVDDPVFARQLFLLSVILLGACAKDDTADMDGEPVGVPQESVPETVPEWYPTPKRTGPPAFRVVPPEERRDAQRVDPQTGRQAPAAGRRPYDGRFDLDNVQWPSDQKTEEYSPWTTEQSPDQRPGGPPVWEQYRRPWGTVEEGTGRSQPAWGTGYGQVPAQPAYPPGDYGQYPQVYPGYVW